ncbi:MAG: phage antirepressor KilAC domain-containing protein [Paludibacteraceae bacterium]|nr:phage antirepressor KilAC domain-containing protein [Paludibacteraceae bacterium]
MEVSIFRSTQFGQIRTTGTSEQPLFCLADLCKALELRPNDVRQRLSDGVVSTHPITDSLGREQQANFVNEDGLYDVILDSRKPEAKAFRKWITGEVLPSIRKSGGYLASREDESPEVIMARALQIAQETINRNKVLLQAKEEQIEAQEKEIKKLSPMADYTREVLQSTDTYTLTQVAKDLGFSSVYKLTSWLQNLKVIYKQSGVWMPTSKYAGRGIFATRTAKFFRSNGEIGTSMSTVVTEKGRAWLHTVLQRHPLN